MAKSVYFGVGGVAKKVKYIYIGVEGVARKVKKGYIGVGGVTRLFYESKKEIISAGTATLSTGITQCTKSGATINNKYAVFIGSKTSNAYVFDESLTQTTSSNFNYSTTNTFAVGGSVGEYAIFGGGLSGSSYPTWTETINTSLTKSYYENYIYGARKASASTSSYVFFRWW